MPVVDLNADLGESYGVWRRGADAALMAAISSANVACGFHAGDPVVMEDTLALARRHGVRVGAHPGLPDRLGFGRRAMAIAPADARAYVLYQVGALQAFCRAAGLRLHHVKPHGALYMMALEDAALARALVEAVAACAGDLAVYTIAGTEMWHAATRAGVRPVAEFFADRPLRPDGSVVMFDWEGELRATPATVAARVRSLLTSGEVASTGGRPVPVRAETICVHADTPGAERIGPAVRAAIEECGFELPGATATMRPAAGGGGQGGGR